MPELPKESRQLRGLEPFGVDADGTGIFFGFTIKEEPGKAIFFCSHKVLGDTIIYLQAAAAAALDKRLKISEHVSDLEARGTRSNPVRQVGFQVELNGQSAAMICSTQDGLSTELQLSFDLLVQMQSQFPRLIEEMKRQQAASLKQH